MKALTRRISLLLAIVSLLSILAIPAFAANACTQNGYLCGWSDDTSGRTFYVTTGKGALLGLLKPSITLTQTKGTIYKYTTSGAWKTEKSYGCYTVSMLDMATGKTTTVIWNASETCKLSLNRGRAYLITVTPDNYRLQHCKQPLFVGWKTPSFWKTKKTSSVTTCL